MSRILSQGGLAMRILIFDYSAPREFPRGWDGVLVMFFGVLLAFWERW